MYDIITIYLHTYSLSLSLLTNFIPNQGFTAVGGGDDQEEPQLKKGKFQAQNGRWYIGTGIKLFYRADGGRVERRIMLDVPLDILPIDADKFLWFLKSNIQELRDVNYNRLKFLYAVRTMEGDVTEPFLEKCNRENWPLIVLVMNAS